MPTFGDQFGIYIKKFLMLFMVDNFQFFFEAF